MVLRRQIAELCAGRDDVIVEHEFRAEGVYRAGDGPGWAVYGWGTTMSPVRFGTPVSAWFDGFDQELDVSVDDRYRFEWRDLSEATDVLSEAVGLCAAVLNGDAWEWRTRRRRGLDVMTPAGRLLNGTDGRSLGLRWWGGHRVRSRRRLPAYGLGPDSVPGGH